MKRLEATALKELFADTASLGLPSPHLTSAARTQLRGALSPALSIILQDVERELGLIGDTSTGVSLRDSSELEEIVSHVARRHGLELSNLERDEILQNLERQNRPFGTLQELVDNPVISDVIVSRYDRIAVQQGRRNFQTDLSFSTPQAYEAFVERLLLRAGATYSTKKPVADGIIEGFARIHVVHKSLCDGGPYLTIRLNRFSSVSVRELITLGVAPKPIFDYLRGIVLSGQTLLIVGEVGTGKTTLARALASQIPDEESILVIEDTAEIRLEHPHVRYVTTREQNTDGAGRVSPSECIRAGMRMAMNRIIFGEMRDAEAAEAFIDVCASGHAGLSTIHARSSLDALTRLELFLGRAQRGVNRQVLSEQITTAVQVIVFIDICRVTGKRRVMEVREIGPVADGVIRQREIFRYQLKDSFPCWRSVNRLSAHKEQLEKLAEPVELFRYPDALELEAEQLYREAALGG